MSILSPVLNPILSVESGLSSLNNLLNSQPSYFSQLHQASFNSVLFFTQSASTQVGRRQAEHVYPFRDVPWVEDIGRKARRYHITGFLVGDDVLAQRDRMQKQLESKGPGVLVHPSYGRLTVSVLDQCSIDEDVSHGRVIKMQLVFEESGLRITPVSSASTGSTLKSSVASSLNSSLLAFVSSTGISGLVSSAYGAVSGAITTGLEWVSAAQGYVTDATNLYNMASGIIGGFGRFFGGSTGSASGSISGTYVSPSQISAQIASLVGTSSELRANVDAAAAAAVSALEGGDPATIGAAVQSLASALASAVTNPADGIRIFSSLSGPVSQSNIQNPVSALCRQSAAIALADVVSAYKPISQQDAASIRAQVCGILDDEILMAGDAGSDDIFYSLTDLRNSVSQYLTAIGASLPPLQVFSMNAPMPALALSYRYYQDITRTDELIGFANPIHPAFMPIQFNGLSS